MQHGLCLCKPRVAHKGCDVCLLTSAPTGITVFATIMEAVVGGWGTITVLSKRGSCCGTTILEELSGQKLLSLRGGGECMILPCTTTHLVWRGSPTVVLCICVLCVRQGYQVGFVLGGGTALQEVLWLGCIVWSSETHANWKLPGIGIRAALTEHLCHQPA
jgi:hypothetical protein